MAKGAKVWAVLTMIQEWWAQIKVWIGMAQKAVHEHKQDQIKDKTDSITPEKPVEDRLDAVEDLEDIANKRT